jgi:hypothetical protein
MTTPRIEELTLKLIAEHRDHPDDLWDWVDDEIQEYLRFHKDDFNPMDLDSHGFLQSTWGRLGHMGQQQTATTFSNIGYNACQRLGYDFSYYIDKEIGEAVFPILVSEWLSMVKVWMAEDEEPVHTCPKGLLN